MTVIDDILKAIKKLADFFEHLGDYVKNAIQAGIGELGDIIKSASSIFVNWIELVIQDFAHTVEMIKDMLSDMATETYSAISSIISFFEKLPDLIEESVKSMLEGLRDALFKVMYDAFDSITTAFNILRQYL